MTKPVKKRKYTREELLLVADFPPEPVIPFIEELYLQFKTENSIVKTKGAKKGVIQKYPGLNRMGKELGMSDKTLRSVLHKKSRATNQMCDRLSVYPGAKFNLNEITEATLEWAAEQKKKGLPGGDWPFGYEPHGGLKVK